VYNPETQALWIVHAVTNSATSSVAARRIRTTATDIVEIGLATTTNSPAGTHMTDCHMVAPGRLVGVAYSPAGTGVGGDCWLVTQPDMNASALMPTILGIAKTNVGANDEVEIYGLGAVIENFPGLVPGMIYSVSPSGALVISDGSAPSLVVGRALTNSRFQVLVG
jgi:hypothetical protein